MNVENTRRVMETNCADTVNQYLRFGWTLINQYVVAATADTPAQVTYVLASLRRLEDTREIIALSDPAEVNAYLARGWTLIDKHASASPEAPRRDEVLHFVLAWQSENPPQHSGAESPAAAVVDEPYLEPDEELC